jgi:hypothetical protein
MFEIVIVRISQDAFSPHPGPILEPDPELVALISESEIKRDPIDKIDPSYQELPGPIPEPSELFDTTVEFQIVVSSMREIPPYEEHDGPTPQSDPDALAPISESEIKRDPIDNIDP